MNQKEILFFVASFFLVVVCWVGFNIYHAHTDSTISDILQTAITPINPTFDTSVIDMLHQRTQITPQDSVSASQSATPTPVVPSISPTISPSTTLLTSPTPASASGVSTP